MNPYLFFTVAVTVDVLFSLLKGQKLPSHLAIYELLLLECLLQFCSINETSQFPPVVFVIAVILFNSKQYTFIYRLPCLHGKWGKCQQFF